MLDVLVAMCVLSGLLQTQEYSDVSRQKAINDKCRDCIYDPLAPGNWRQQTGACTIRSCALWPFRPVSKPDRRSSQIQAETGREPTKEST